MNKPLLNLVFWVAAAIAVFALANVVPVNGLQSYGVPICAGIVIAYGLKRILGKKTEAVLNSNRKRLILMGVIFLVAAFVWAGVTLPIFKENPNALTNSIIGPMGALICFSLGPAMLMIVIGSICFGLGGTGISLKGQK